MTTRPASRMPWKPWTRIRAPASRTTTRAPPASPEPVLKQVRAGLLSADPAEQVAAATLSFFNMWIKKR